MNNIVKGLAVWGVAATVLIAGYLVHEASAIKAGDCFQNTLSGYNDTFARVVMAGKTDIMYHYVNPGENVENMTREVADFEVRYTRVSCDKWEAMRDKRYAIRESNIIKSELSSLGTRLANAEATLEVLISRKGR